MATLKVPHQVGDLGAYLKEQREGARLSLRQLATAAGVSNPYLSQIERGLRKPSAEVLQQIAKGLQISAEALFLRAGLLEDSGGLDVEVALQSDMNLTARQKRVLLDIYATFRAENARSQPLEESRSGAAGVAELKSLPDEADGSGEDHDGTRSGGTRKRATKAARAPRRVSNPRGDAAVSDSPPGAAARRRPRTSR
jgi:transcriptional regulator with XRE-family HTH domain